jgi:hypothetical protein
MSTYVLSSKPKRGRPLPEWLEQLLIVKAINQDSKYLSMGEIAEQCGVTSHAAFSVLGDLIKPVTEELQGNHWVDKFSISDVRDIGKKYKAGFRWREKVELGEARELCFEHASKGKKPLEVTAEIRGVEFHGQRFLHALIDKGDCEDVAREFLETLLKEYNFVELLESFILIQSAKDPSKASITAFRVHLPGGKLDIVTNRATPGFIKAILAG